MFEAENQSARQKNKRKGIRNIFKTGEKSKFEKISLNPTRNTPLQLPAVSDEEANDLSKKSN